MRATMMLGAGVLFLALASGARAQEEREDAAQASALAWLGLVDQGSYGESWEGAAKLFKGAVPKEKWARDVKAAREPLGRILNRKVKSRELTKTLPGAPDGQYVLIQFDSSFEGKKDAVETIVPMRDPDGAWRVSGYYVK